MLASRQHRCLLETFLPPNVLETVCKMEKAQTQTQTQHDTRAGDVLVCAEIRWGTVVFCAWKAPVASPDDFEGIGNLVAEFDRLVTAHGMFKYQYVSYGIDHNYVVCCPFVAAPFVVREQQPQGGGEGGREKADSYPAEFSETLLRLAWALSCAGRRFTSPQGCGMSVKVVVVVALNKT